MANENLKRALTDARLTVEEFADILKVDPKSVQRWIAGPTMPYPRHRAKIARALNLTEHDLWPQEAPAAPAEASPADADADSDYELGDVVASWGRATDPGAPTPIECIATAQTTIDLLDTGGHPDNLRDWIGTLRRHSLDGLEIRILTRAPADQLADLAPPPDGIAIRSTTSLTMPNLVRADDTILLTMPFTATEPPALLKLQPRTTGGMFDRTAERFQALWDEGVIVHEPDHALAQPATATRSSDNADTPPATTARPDPTDPGPSPSTSSNDPDRRWPRRPS